MNCMIARTKNSLSMGMSNHYYQTKIIDQCKEYSYAWFSSRIESSIS